METDTPQIVLPGWWWKKYFRSYRILRVTMQDMMDFQWNHGGREEHKILMDKMMNLYLDQKFLSAFPPMYITGKQKTAQ